MAGNELTTLAGMIPEGTASRISLNATLYQAGFTEWTAHDPIKPEGQTINTGTLDDVQRLGQQHCCETRNDSLEASL